MHAPALNMEGPRRRRKTPGGAVDVTKAPDSQATAEAETDAPAFSTFYAATTVLLNSVRNAKAGKPSEQS
jgi:hypothetical protein